MHKIRMAWTLIGAAALASISSCRAQEPKPGQQEQKPIRLLAEAEDFKIEKGAWKVVPYRENYFASTFAITFLSRMGCLGAPEQVEKGKEAAASQVINIPYDGEFEVLARYEQPYNFSAEFAIEIVQNGKVVDRKVCGRLQDPKIWALNGHQRVPMERYWWGGTDNIVWQNPGSVKLGRGQATIRLIAGPQMDGDKPRINAAKRNVDMICLTNDKAGMEAQKGTNYLEFDGWLVQDGDLFVRITNPKDGLGPCIPVIAPSPSGQHSPYYIHIRDWPTTKILKSGRLVDATKYTLAGPRSEAVKSSLLAPTLDPGKFTKPSDPNNPNSPPTMVIPDNEYLQPGDRSGWVPIGQVLDALHNSQWIPEASYKDKVEGLHLKLEFAVSDGRGGLKIIKDITVKGKPDYYSPVTFEMPGNVAPNPALLRILKERYWLPQIRTQREALAWLNAAVAKFPKKGPTAKRFLIYNIMGFSGALDAFPEARQLALALGDNTAVGQEGKKRKLVAHWPDVSPEYYTKADVSDVYVISYGDETHLPAVKLSNEEFAAWLQAKGVKVEGPVKWTQDRNDPLYYYSVIAGVEQGAKPYIEASAYYKSKGALTGASTLR